MFESCVKLDIGKKDSDNFCCWYCNRFNFF